ncbi:MAG: PKD domain-containing protein, partial [Chitinophagales bacterium]
LSNSVSQGTINNHTINVPAGTSRLKVMVYWADPEGSTSAAQALVNDLDATMTDGSNVFFPWLLNTTPNAASLNQPASRGVDNLNNVEQIAIDNPSASSYTLTVSGSTIPFGNAQYWVTWEYINDTPVVIFPMGGEGLEPNTNVRIQWDAWNSADNFFIEYSLDDGNTWIPISTVLGSLRILTWTTPNVQTGKARIRVSQNGLSGVSTENFSLMRRPEDVRVDRVCQDDNQLVLAWDPVIDAFNYDIFMLGSQYMDSIGNTTDTSFTITVSDLSEEQWLAVRANGINGMRSNRTIAIPFEGLGSGGQNSCVLSCKSDIDAGIQAITSNLPDGDLCNQNIAQGLDIIVENLGDVDLGFVEVSFQVNDGPVISEFLSGTLPSRGSLAHSFGSILFIDRPGSNTLKIWTNALGDSTQCNDTLYRTINLSKADLPDNTTQQGCLGEPAILTFDNLLGDVTWFDNGNPVGQGPTFTTPSLTFQRFYQAQQTIPSSPLQAGPSGTDFGGGGYHGSNGFFPALEFDADTNFIIKSVLVDADGAGNRTIEIRQGTSNGNAIYSETFSLNDGPQRIELDATIPGPGTYFIGGNGMELYRNNSGTDYPYITEGIVTITRSTATTDPDAYYYYFYDWEIALGPCVGNLVNVFAEPIELSINASGIENNIDFSASTTNSSLNDEWQWDFGDGGSSTDASPSHTYYNVGDYNVSVTANRGCSRDTVITITTISTIEDPESTIRIQLYPNPGNGVITLHVESLENYTVNVLSADGKLMKRIDAQAGVTENVLNTAAWSQGIYWVSIENNGFTHTLPLIIE